MGGQQSPGQPGPQAPDWQPPQQVGPAQPTPEQPVPGQPVPGQYAGQPMPMGQHPNFGAPYAPVLQPVTKPPATPQRPASYYQFLRTPRWRWWRPLVALLILGAGVFAANVIVVIPMIVHQLMTQGAQADLSLTTMTPLMLLLTNLGLAACIPIGMLAEKAGYGSAGRWLHSVQRRFRWKWFGLSLVIFLGFSLVQYGIEFALAPEALKPEREWLAYLLVVLLTTPFQCAGEEYLARGVVGRAVASWIGHEYAALVVGAIFSSAVFMALHASTDLWLNLSYFSWAFVLSVACWLFGGLETAVAAHIVNNLLAFGVSIGFGQMGSVMERESGAGSPMMLMMTAIAVLAVAVLWKLFGRSGLCRLSDPVLTAGVVPAVASGAMPDARAASGQYEQPPSNPDSMT